MDENGHISVQFIGSGLPKFASNDRLDGTPEENKAVVQGILCYFGTYSVSDADRSLNIHIESSSFPNWKGADQKRFLTLTEDEMRWINPTVRPPGQVLRVTRYGNESSKRSVGRSQTDAPVPRMLDLDLQPKLPQTATPSPRRQQPSNR